MTDTENNGWNSVITSSEGNFASCDKNGEVIEHTPATEEPAPLRHEHLTAYIQRIEKLEEEKAAIAADVKEVYLEAKGTGFDVAIMKKVVAARKKSADELSEEQALFDLYWDQTGGGE